MSSTWEGSVLLKFGLGSGNQRQYDQLYDGQGRQGEPFLVGLVGEYESRDNR